MQITKEEFVRNRKSDFNDYENLLKALIVLKKDLEENLGAKYYFGGKLKKEGKPDQTPDIIIELKEKGGIVGEAKKSLRGLYKEESKSNYIKTYVEGDIFKQLRKYDDEFDNFKVSNHDLILLAPYSNTEALGIIKFDFLEKESNPFKRNFAILLYSIELQANTERIIVKYDYGKIDNQSLFDKLRRGINYYKGQITKELGKYKIYEENEHATPLEYVMVILWDSIFNEIIKSSDKSNIVNRYKNKENKFEVKLSVIMDHLKKMYTLPTISNDGVNNNHRQQFKINLVKDAMDIFCHIGLAKINQKDNSDILYEVTLRALPEKDELNYFLSKIYETMKDKKTELNAEGIEKLDKYFRIN